MTSEIQVYSKDSLKLNILNDVLNGVVNLSFQLNDGNSEDYASSIHKEGKRVQVYGKFNISESPTGDILTIRPIMIDCSLKILFQTNVSFSGKKISLIRSTTKSVEQEFEITSETSYIELIPQGKKHYAMSIKSRSGTPVAPINSVPSASKRRINTNTKHEEKPNTIIHHESHSSEIEPIALPQDDVPSKNDERFQGFDLGINSSLADERFASFDLNNDTVVSSGVSSKDGFSDIFQEDTLKEDNNPNTTDYDSTSEMSNHDLGRIEQEISVIERQQDKLTTKKQKAIEHLEKIEAEYKKDYESFEKELDEVKSRMKADASIIEHYKDQDVMPIEIIFQEVRLKLEEAEEQIRLFIEAKQRKTMEIEREIKSTKKR